jgi:hypothetical protein
MKFDVQKAYPYPVLRPFSDDFRSVEFQTAVESRPENETLTVKIEFVVSSVDIIREIEAQRAAYFAVVACRNTYFRKSFISTNVMLEARIELKYLRDEVSIESYIVATKDIKYFNSADINLEFGNGPFEYKPGQILAQDEPQSFYIDRHVFKPITSVFDLVKNENLSGAEWTVNFDNDHVQIAVSPAMKEKIDNARNVAENRAILINSIYFGAVMQAIQNLKEKTGDYDTYRWAEVITRKMHNMNINIDQCLAYQATERLMNFPLSLLSTYVFKGE